MSHDEVQVNKRMADFAERVRAVHAQVCEKEDALAQLLRQIDDKVSTQGA